MEKIYTFQSRGKILFYLAAFICIISLILIPIGILFIIMAVRAKLILYDDHLTYTMLTTKNINYKDITKIKLAKAVNPRYYLQQENAPGVYINLVSLIPLIIEYNNKKTKLSANFFNNAEEFLKILQQKTKKKLEIEKE